MKKRGQNQREEIQKSYIPSNYPRECWLRIKTITTVWVCNTKKINQGNVINKIEINKVKLNVLLINSI